MPSKIQSKNVDFCCAIFSCEYLSDDDFEIKSKIHSFSCLSCFELQDNFIFLNLFVFVSYKGKRYSNNGQNAKLIDIVFIR